MGRGGHVSYAGVCFRVVVRFSGDGLRHAVVVAGDRREAAERALVIFEDVAGTLAWRAGGYEPQRVELVDVTPLHLYRAHDPRHGYHRHGRRS